MRALLQREITEQEYYIKKTLTKLGVPFKKSLHFRVNKAYTSFSVKLKKQFSSKELLKVQQAFPEEIVVLSDNFMEQITKGKFVEIRIPNQTSHFFHLWELLSSRQFTHYKGVLPIALGLDYKDLYIIDLATTKHIAIESDEPSYLYKVQQLFLHSLLTLRPFQKRTRIAWIDERKQHPELLSRIEPFMLTEATQVEEILTLVVKEYVNKHSGYFYVTSNETKYHLTKEEIMRKFNLKKLSLKNPRFFVDKFGTDRELSNWHKYTYELPQSKLKDEKDIKKAKNIEKRIKKRRIFWILSLILCLTLQILFLVKNKKETIHND